jgi:outer membrane protein
MSLKLISAAGLGLLASLAMTQSASAQAAPAAAKTAPAAPAPIVLTTGPAIAGVCVYSGDRAILSSTVGKYVVSRIQTIEAQANAELTAERNAILADGKALEAQRATLPQEQLEQKALQLNQRGQALQRKAQQRGREIEATQQKALSRVNDELQPFVRDVFQQRSCSLLLDANAVMLTNPAMDITEAAVVKLNAKITQFAFERERLEPAPAQAPAQ